MLYRCATFLLAKQCWATDVLWYLLRNYSLADACKLSDRSSSRPQEDFAPLPYGHCPYSDVDLLQLQERVAANVPHGSFESRSAVPHESLESRGAPVPHGSFESRGAPQPQTAADWYYDDAALQADASLLQRDNMLGKVERHPIHTPTTRRLHTEEASSELQMKLRLLQIEEEKLKLKLQMGKPADLLGLSDFATPAAPESPPGLGGTIPIPLQLFDIENVKPVGIQPAAGLVGPAFVAAELAAARALVGSATAYPGGVGDPSGLESALISAKKTAEKVV